MATVNVPHGSSMEKFNGQSFPIVRNYGDSVDLNINGHSIMFQMSEVVING